MTGPTTVTLPQQTNDIGVDERQSAARNASCERVRERAYYKWQAAGCPCGDGDEFWLQAEAELVAETQLEGDARVA